MAKKENPFRATLATSADRAQVKTLLVSSCLPSEDLDNVELWVIKENGSVLGSTGLEIWGTQGLLRSVSVEHNSRKQGLGTSLVKHVINEAMNRNVTELFLISETAELFFQKFGFVRIPRDQVNGGVRNSPEFRGGCPGSSIVMRLSL